MPAAEAAGTALDSVVNVVHERRLMKRNRLVIDGDSNVGGRPITHTRGRLTEVPLTEVFLSSR